jgi:hypothetical protein
MNLVLIPILVSIAVACLFAVIGAIGIPGLASPHGVRHCSA